MLTYKDRLKSMRDTKIRHSLHFTFPDKQIS